MFGPTPNITGVLKRGSGVQPFAGPEGAFSFGDVDARFANQGSEGSSANIFFDANKSSSIYSGTKLQNAALQTLPCIRI